MENKYEILRIWAEALYDHQDIRISSMNRVRNLIRRRLLDLGFSPEKKKNQKETEKEQLWTDNEIIQLLDEAEESNKLSEADSSFLKKSFELALKESDIEKDYERNLKPMIEQEPIWKEWLQYVNGISTRNACRLLRYFGYCEKANTVSQLWAYSGLAVKDGQSIKRKKGEQLPYNLKIKTGVVGVIGDSLIKASKSYKKLVYDSYKAYIEERGCCPKKHPKHKDKLCKDYPGHRHAMAQRKMVKIFLAHYWLKCREIKGLPTREPYPIDKLGHTSYMKPFYDKKPSTP